jgi:cell filamentation protein, protein adenylyltransferase
MRLIKYVWSDIWHLESHHSTALEGNTLVLREVEVLLDKGRAVGAKPLREYMEVQGYRRERPWRSLAGTGTAGSAARSGQ